jgi:hypothetical protein
MAAFSWGEPIQDVDDLGLGVAVQRDHNSGRESAFEEAEPMSGLIRWD